MEKWTDGGPVHTSDEHSNSDFRFEIPTTDRGVKSGYSVNYQFRLSTETRAAREERLRGKDILSSLAICLAQVLQPAGVLDNNCLASLRLRPGALNVGDLVDAHCACSCRLLVCWFVVCVSEKQVSDRTKYKGYFSSVVGPFGSPSFI